MARTFEDYVGAIVSNLVQTAAVRQEFELGYASLIPLDYLASEFDAVYNRAVQKFDSREIDSAVRAQLIANRERAARMAQELGAPWAS